MVFVALAVVVLSVFLFLYLWKPFGDFYKGRKLPPGPIRWPVLGSIPQMMMVDTEYPFRQITGLCRKYGDIASIGFGGQYTVVLSTFEVMNDLLKRPEAILNRFLFQFTSQRMNGKNLGVIWSSGEVWQQVRTYTVKTLRDFGFGKTRTMEETLMEEIDSLMEDIREKSESNGGVWEVDSNRLSVVSINVLWSSVGGYRFDPSSSNIKRHIDLNTEIFEILRPTNLLSIFPFLKFFPKLSGYERHGEIHRNTRQFMKDLIEEVKLRREGRQEPESFIEVFLDKIEKDAGVPGSVMTEEQLIVVLMDLFLAGTETSSTVMNWMILYFALNQGIQEKARCEVLKMSDGGTMRIPLAAFNKMPYVSACIYETMRHSPFGPLPPPREASSDIICGDYIIPKGTCIFFNLYSIFHDPAYWGDENIFRPERFLDETGAQLDSDKVERIAQFGFGKRICPGKAMAMDTLFAFVVSFLSTFSVHIVKGKEATIELGTPALTICPKPYVVSLKPLR